MMPKRFKYEREANSGKRNKKSVFSAVFISVSLLIVSSAALSVSYFSLAKEISPFFQSVFSRSWSKTEGNVIKTFTSTKSVPCGGRNSRGCLEYVPNVVYLYRVGDKEYQGERINFSAVNTFKSKEETDSYLNSYGDKAVEVFTIRIMCKTQLSVGNMSISSTIIMRVAVAEARDFSSLYCFGLAQKI